MHPDKVDRDRLHRFTDLPNIGPAMAADFELLGYQSPDDLRGLDPWTLYADLSQATRAYQDPCVLDTFMSVTRFLDGEPPRPWWAFTDERKARYAVQLAAMQPR